MDTSGRTLFFHANIMKAFDIGRFYTKDAFFVWANLGKHSVVHLLCVSSIKTGTRCILRPDELPLVVRRSRRISKDSSSRRIKRLVPPVFILETHNQTNY